MFNLLMKSCEALENCYYNDRNNSVFEAYLQFREFENMPVMKCDFEGKTLYCDGELLRAFEEVDFFENVIKNDDDFLLTLSVEFIEEFELNEELLREAEKIASDLYWEKIEEEDVVAFCDKFNVDIDKHIESYSRMEADCIRLAFILTEELITKLVYYSIIENIKE